MFEVAGGFLDNAACGSYHWGLQCFVDLGIARTGCLSHAALPYDEGFHTYSAHWSVVDSSSWSIQWYYDNTLIFTITPTSDPLAPPPLGAMAIHINTALAWWLEPRSRPPGLDAAGGYTFMFVDWIRVWTADDDGAPAAPLPLAGANGAPPAPLPLAGSTVSPRAAPSASPRARSRVRVRPTPSPLRM